MMNVFLQNRRYLTHDLVRNFWITKAKRENVQQLKWRTIVACNEIIAYPIRK